MADWARVANTTIRKYIRDEEVNILRNRKLTALAKSKGRITFNHGGDGMDWKVRYRMAPMTGYADTDTLVFARQNRWKTATLEYRGYVLTDSLTKLERLKNRSTEAIVKLYENVASTMRDEIEDQFGDEWYVDGNAAGNEKRFHGIQSFTGNTGVQANGYIATPDDSYAQLDTDLGGYGGSWSTVSANVNWPAGTGDAEYHFWSPLLIDYTDTAWAASTDNWANNAIEAIRFAIVHGRTMKSKRGEVDLFVFEPELYRLFLQAYESSQRILVDRGGDKGTLRSLGFGDVMNFDGAEITQEYGIATNTGYGWNFDAMELRSMQSQLFEPEGPIYDEATRSYRFSIDCLGNLRFNPRQFCRFANYT